MESLDSILSSLQNKHTNDSKDQSLDSKTDLAKHPKSEKPYESEQAKLDALCQDFSSASLPNQAIASQFKSGSSSGLKSGSNSLDRLLDDLRNDSAASDPNLTKDSTAESPEILQTASSVTAPDSLRIQKDLQKVADRQKHQSQQEITKQATAWLKKLDPLSGEGLWFEEFAKNYPSKLEAAIALLSS